MNYKNDLSKLFVAILMAFLIIGAPFQAPLRAASLTGCGLSYSIPGGGTITFVSNRDGYQELYIIDGSECNIHQLTHDQYFATAPAWSPDGSKVAYTSTNSALYVMNADGSGRHQFLSSAPGTQGYPDWSPDGSKIVFNIDVGWQAIYVANADGTDLMQLLSIPGRDNGSPNWTPDGTRIIYLDRSDPGNDGEIAIMNADGSNRHYLMPDNSTSEGYPSLSPDGGKIAFVSNRDGNWEIYTMDFDGTSGSNVQRLTNDPAEDNWPRWSPDSTRLVFHSYRDGSWEIYVMYADGNNQTRITNNSAFDYQPTWGGPSINQSPTVSISGPYAVDEGGTVQLSATGTDPDGDTLTYAWDLDDNGTFETTGQSVTFSAVGLDGPSSYTITVKVTDSGGLSATAQTIVNVLNVAPTASFNTPASVNEGSSITLSLTSPSDPSSADTAAGFTYAFDCGDGSGYGAFGSSDSASCSTTDNGTRAVRGQIKDKDNRVTEYTANVTINNVAPSVNTPSVSPEPFTQGSSVTASATFNDPGINDAPFTCTVNYGDGSGSLAGTINDNTCTGPAHTYINVGSYTVSVSVTDKDNDTGSNSMLHSVIYNFTGFFQPVDNLPTLNLVNAGRAIPVKFSLNGDQGLNIFAAGYPKSEQIACDSTSLVDGIEQTVTAGSSSLSYDPSTDQYTYVWKTDKTWAGTCRQLVVKLNDGTFHRANFKFK